MAETRLLGAEARRGAESGVTLVFFSEAPTRVHHWPRPEAGVEAAAVRRPGRGLQGAAGQARRGTMPGVRREAVAWGTRSYRSRADHVQGPRPSRRPRLPPWRELGCGEPAWVLRPAGMWGARCPAPTPKASLPALTLWRRGSAASARWRRACSRPNATGRGLSEGRDY